MTDFKQIIGRGTRVKEEYGKISFNIVDYTNSTVLFKDPDFDGEPALIITSEIDDEGEVIETQEEDFTEDEGDETEEDKQETDRFWGLPDYEDSLPRKFYVDGGREEIVEEQIYDLGTEMELRLSQLIDYTREQVRVLYRSQIYIQEKWSNPEERSQVIELLADKGIDFDQLREITGKTDADPFDLLCHLAFDAPVLTYKQRAEQMKKKHKSFFEQYGESAKVILEILLDKYAEKGLDEFTIPTTFKANQEFRNYGNTIEIAQRFGGVEQLKLAVKQLQILLYSA